MSVPLVTAWLEALGYEGIGDALVSDAKRIGRRPYAAELRDLVDPEGEYRLDAVFTVESTPTVCFIDGARVPKPEDIDALRQRLWNQNLVSALLVLHPAELTAYAVPKWKRDSGCESLLRLEADRDGRWSIGEVQSCAIQQRLESWFDPSRRVDRDLVRQLSLGVTALVKGPGALMGHQLQAQMLLAQILFISYLEHRKIVGDEYRKVHNLRTLYELVSDGDGSAIDALIKQLKDDFNGDFLEPSEVTWSDLDARSLSIVKKLLSRVNIETGQADFWNYDFSQIPVELLSGIYETFLQDKRKIDGAYYTPRMLAELATQQAFEGFSELSDLRVYDGACGSGILLTTAYRKIVADQEMAVNRSIDINERIDLLKRTIFGGDVNKIACRVTAFSLYLCLLERLSPSDLIRLQRDHSCKLPHLVGTNIAEGKSGDFFSATNPFSSSRSFDVVLSNPPWREIRLGEAQTAIDWAQKNKVRLPHKQFAASFAAKACEAAKPGGRITLILPSSLITAPTNADFLRQCAVRVTVERMINLSDFRRLLFPTAEHACTILRATNTPGLVDKKIQGQFEYWMPKVDISFAFNRLTLHEYDAMKIERSSLIEDNAILRRRAWGSQRDESLIQRLAQFPKVGHAIKDRGWVAAKGYHKKDGEKKVDPGPLKELSYLYTEVLNTSSPVIDVGKLQPLPADKGIANYGDLRMYKEGPCILWPDGTSVEIEVRAGYSESSFCFSSGTGGIRFQKHDRAVARLLTCYLRSSLATYWLILTGYSATTERARVTMDEIKSLPFIHPSRHPNSEKSAEALKRADELLLRFEGPGNAIFAGDTYQFASDGVDDLIFDYFGLASNERILINDMVALAAKSLQPTSYAELLTPLQGSEKLPATEYIRQLDEALTTWSRNSRGNGVIKSKLVSRGRDRTPLDVVHIALGATDHAVNRESPHAESVRDLLRAIALRIEAGSSIDFFSMPNSIFVWGDDVYIVKPARMRFWTKSAALRDADEVFQLLVSSTGGVAAA